MIAGDAQAVSMHLPFRVGQLGDVLAKQNGSKRQFSAGPFSPAFSALLFFFFFPTTKLPSNASRKRLTFLSPSPGSNERESEEAETIFSKLW